MFEDHPTPEIISPTQAEGRGRRRRLSLALLAALALPACAGGQPGDGANGGRSALDGQASSPRSFAKYIAFGDSFSSGFGEQPARSLVSKLFGTCKGVSDHPWSKLLLDQTLKPANAQVQYEEEFCFGHKVADLRSAVDRMSQAPANSLITFTIGGNDTGVSSEFLTCLNTDCRDASDRVLQKLQSQEFRNELEGLVDALRAKAPSSTIVMVGYPHLLAAKPSAQCQGRSSLPSSGDAEQDQRVIENKAKTINGLVDKMNALINDVATKKSKDGTNKNVTITAVTKEVVQKFAGHEACSAKEWIGFSSLMHPDANGHLAYAKVVATKLGGLVPTRIATVAPNSAGVAGTSSPGSTGTSSPGTTGTSKPGSNAGISKPGSTGTSKPGNTGTSKPGTSKPGSTGSSGSGNGFRGPNDGYCDADGYCYGLDDGNDGNCDADGYCYGLDDGNDGNCDADGYCYGLDDGNDGNCDADGYCYGLDDGNCDADGNCDGRYGVIGGLDDDNCDADGNCDGTEDGNGGPDDDNCDADGNCDGDYGVIGGLYDGNCDADGICDGSDDGNGGPDDGNCDGSDDGSCNGSDDGSVDDTDV